MSAILSRINVDYEQPISRPWHGGQLLHAPRLGARAGRAVAARARGAERPHPQPAQSRNAVMVSHYYVHPDLQDLAEETGGIVSRFAGDGALWPRPCGADAGGVGRALHGRDRQDPVARKARADARPGRHLLARPGLPDRRIQRLLRRAPRPHRGGLCQHQRGREGAGRLGGHVELRAGHRARAEGHRARKSSGRPTGTWAATSSARPAPTW